jgi:serine/threonine-protein kinase
MSGAGGDHTLVGQIVLGRYRVLRQLAQGGMGAVYLGRTEGAKGFTRPVVIKRILPSLTHDEDTSRMFVREARLLAMLQDPGIVNVVDFGHEAHGGLVMVLDYVHGYHLGYWLRYLTLARGHMPVEMALHIAIRVLEALHYAHTFKRADGRSLQIIHRDVTPANILLDFNGNVKLVDFGIARAQGDADEYHTEAPRVKGKFGYMPPETFRGDEPTVQADIYACGVVLYELLTGNNPFRGKEITDTYHKVLNLVPPPVGSLRADVPKEIDGPIFRALAKDASQRFTSAKAFANALRALRSVPEEVTRSMLSAEAQQAFSGPLATALQIEPLSARDAAWREASDSEDSLQNASSAPPSYAVYEAPTRVADEVATVAFSPRDRPSEKEEPTERTRPKSRAPLLWLAGSLLVALATLAGVLLGRDTARSSGDRIVVIEREKDAPSPQAEAVPAALVEVPSKPPSSPPRAAPSPAAQPGHAAPLPALAPDPQLLTRAFARQQQRVQACFAKHADALDAQPELAFNFRVSASGAVEHAELTPQAVSKTALGACLLAVASSTRFPKLEQAVAFRIPITARRVPIR